MELCAACFLYAVCRDMFKGETLLKFILGGSIIVAQTAFANASSPYYSGLVYAAPVLLVPSVLFVHKRSNAIAMVGLCAFIILSGAVYNIALWWLLSRGYSKVWSIVLALIPWAPAAILLGKAGQAFVEN